jgi:hypothetical protein
MPAYRITLNGENYRMERCGKVVKMGFFATWEVEAAEHAEAESLARAALASVEELGDNVKNTPDSPPNLVTESIVDVPGGRAADAPPKIDWYAHDDDEDLGDPMAEVDF